MRLAKTKEFIDWFESLHDKGQAQVDARLNRIQENDYFGDSKSLGDSLYELRWKNGWRVYFTLIADDEGRLAFLLLGGMKNAQKKDIERARFLLRRYASPSS